MNAIFFFSIDGFDIPISCHKIVVKEAVVAVKLLIANHSNILLFEIQHHKAYTLFDMTKVSPYELWFFDQRQEFIAKSFCLQKGDAPLQIQTKAPYIALIPRENVNAKLTKLITDFKCDFFRLGKDTIGLSNNNIEEKYAYSLDRKEQVFKTWDELILLFELTDLLYPNNEIVKKVHKMQTEKKVSTERFHTRSQPNEAIKNLDVNLDESTLKSLIKKWEELIIDAYIYLQEARKRGGTFGHKVGPIWAFQKKLKEQFEGELLKLTPIDIYHDK